MRFLAFSIQPSAFRGSANYPKFRIIYSHGRSEAPKCLRLYSQSLHHKRRNAEHIACAIGIYILCNFGITVQNYIKNLIYAREGINKVLTGSTFFYGLLTADC